jgi:hypothetical protein
MSGLPPFGQVVEVKSVRYFLVVDADLTIGIIPAFQKREFVGRRIFMTTFTLMVGTGNDKVSAPTTVRHSLEIHAPTIANAIAQATQKIERDPDFYGTDRVVITASDGTVVWTKPDP